MKHLKKFELFEGKTEKAAKTGHKHTEIKADKKDSMRKSIGDHIKSLEAETKKVGDDLEVHLDDKHIAQVMFRNDYIAVKKEGNKFPKEFEYTQLGKIKSELSDIVKSSK
jgi:hypothetical protein